MVKERIEIMVYLIPCLKTLYIKDFQYTMQQFCNNLAIKKEWS